MFGYIVPHYGVLSESDKRLWQGFYCTLCREIGKYSQPARLGLSYDLTFLAILSAALSDKEPTLKGGRRCIFHPFKKADIYDENEAFSYAARASVVLVKEKLTDDAKDEKKRLYSLFAKFIKDVSDSDKLKKDTDSSLLSLSEIERLDIRDADEAADAFAILCGKLFMDTPSQCEKKRTLYWLGYNLGRWIYLLDAFDDFEKDIKKGNYNPFKDNYDSQRIDEMLTFTLSEAAAAFDLLDIKRYKTLLENILYLGLPARQQEVMKGKTE